MNSIWQGKHGLICHVLRHDGLLQAECEVNQQEEEKNSNAT